MDSLTDLLHLYHASAFHHRSPYRLLEAFGHDPARLRHASDAELNRHGVVATDRTRLRESHARAVEADLDWAALDGNRLLGCCDPEYPPLLREIEDPPVLLYLRGKVSLASRPQIAIVGSRHCSPGGAVNASEFAAALAAAGLAITSGLALGIDSRAHRGALDAGGETLAILGGGLQHIYPARNTALAECIADNGLLISEFPLTSKPAKHHFPRRNRIISVLALATLVVEAAERSGSLITARLAAEQGREVFALPGSIHNPLARGCHRLIRDGARLAETPEELLDGLGPLYDFSISAAAKPGPRTLTELDPQQRKLLDAIGFDPVDCDLIQRRSGLTIEQLSSMLPLLELNDLIRSAPGGCYVRI